MNHISKEVITRHFQKILLVRFPQSKRFEQFCQGELSFSFTKVNCDVRQHFSRLFFVQSCDQYFSFPCCYVIKELVHDLAVLLSSYGCTWEVWRALGKLELLSAIASSNSYAFLLLSKLPACIHNSIDAR